ncbi:MAG: lamin tail domain-containing protein, partial [bacterium]|nr:lamin tail domain-containing protein [bacterium]
MRLLDIEPVGRAKHMELYRETQGNVTKGILLDVHEGKAIRPGDGEILKMNYAISDQAASGDYELWLSHSQLTDNGRPAQAISHRADPGTVQVTDRLVALGDARGYPGESVNIVATLRAQNPAAGLQVKLKWPDLLDVEGMDNLARNPELDFFSSRLQDSDGTVILIDLSGGTEVEAGDLFQIRFRIPLDAPVGILFVEIAEAILTDIHGQPISILARRGRIDVQQPPAEPQSVELPEGSEFLRISEILADPPPGLGGDANGDGKRDGREDEFVELWNAGTVPVPIGGWVLGDDDASANRMFKFPEGTVIEPGARVVLFGGGTPRGVPGLVFTDDGTIGNGLTNAGDTVLLIEPVSGDTVLAEAYVAPANANQSLVKRGSAWQLHSEGLGRGLFSPGRERPVLEVLFPHPITIQLEEGGMRQYEAAGRYSDQEVEVLKESVIWSVGDTLLARISRRGKLDALRTGKTEVRFEWRGVRSVAAEVDIIAKQSTDQKSEDINPQSNVPDRPADPISSTERLAGLRLLEVFANPGKGLLGDANGDGRRGSFEDEFVEFYNSGSNTVDMSGWYIGDDDVRSSRLFQVPHDTRVAPGQTVTLFGGGDPQRISGLVFVDDGRIGDGLSNRGDRVVLIASNATDTLAIWEFPRTKQGVSWILDVEGGWHLHNLLPRRGGMSPGSRSPQLEQLFLDRDSLRVSIKDTIDLAARGRFSDGEVEDLTEEVQIRIGDGAVVRIGTRNRLFAIREGTSWIQACWEEFCSDRVWIRVGKEPPGESGVGGGIGQLDSLTFVDQDSSGVHGIPVQEDSLSVFIPVDTDSVGMISTGLDTLARNANQSGRDSTSFQDGVVLSTQDSTKKGDGQLDALESEGEEGQNNMGGQPGVAQVVVPSANLAPFFISNPDSVALIGMLFIYVPRAEDPEGKAVSFEISDLPGWLSWDGEALRGIPGESDRGVSQVGVYAKDEEHCVKQVWYTRVGSARSLFELPEVSHARVGLTWRLPLKRIAGVQIQTEGGPEWDATSGQLVWKPEAGDEGERNVIVGLSGKGPQEQFVPILVTVAPKPPIEISEILVRPPMDLNGDGRVEKFSDQMIELFNAGEDLLDISGWSLGDDDGLPYVFPPETGIGAGAILTLVGQIIEDFQKGIYTAGGKIGNGLAGSDRVLLVAPQGPDTLLDVRYQGGNIEASLIPDPLHPGQWISHQKVYGRPFSFGKRDPFPIRLPEPQDREALPDDIPEIRLVTP